MSQMAEIVVLVGGRLAIDFANAPSYPSAPSHDFSWEEFVGFLEAAKIVSAERSDQLLTLPETDPRAAHASHSSRSPARRPSRDLHVTCQERTRCA